MNTFSSACRDAKWGSNTGCSRSSGISCAVALWFWFALSWSYAGTSKRVGACSGACCGTRALALTGGYRNQGALAVGLHWIGTAKREATIPQKNPALRGHAISCWGAEPLPKREPKPAKLRTDLFFVHRSGLTALRASERKWGRPQL